MIPPYSGWKWGGCSRDVSFGLRYSERFVDATEDGRKKTARKDMNRHNNRAGRQVIQFDQLYVGGTGH